MMTSGTQIKTIPILSVVVAFTLFSISLGPRFSGRSSKGRPGAATEKVSSASSSQLPTAESRAASDYSKRPFSFEPNLGQTDSHVKFIARGIGYSLFLTSDEAVMSLTKQTSRDSFSVRANGSDDPGSAIVKSMPPLSAKRIASHYENPQAPAKQSAVLRMKLVNANRQPLISGLDARANKTNYFIGNDPKTWASSVGSFGKVQYRDVYPGIDLIYYGNDRQLEYDFKVAPGANAEAISIAFSRTNEIKVDQQGELILRVGDEEIRQHKPVIYQESFGTRQQVSGRYLLKQNGEVGFQIDTYDPSRTLVIDPTVSYATFLGGSGDDLSFGMVTDAQGNTYLAGATSSIDFPGATPFQANYGGGTFDAFVAKVSPDGSQLLYSTYLGGSGDDRAFGLAVDAAGNAYITGFTDSPNFPTANPLQPTKSNGRDAFIAKLNPSGTGMIYSTFLGSNGDDRGMSIGVDSAGNVVTTGLTNSPGFPKVDAFQPTLGGGPADAFVAKLNSQGSALMYSSYLGGSGGTVFGELANDLALDSAGNVYIVGFTESTSFPTKNPLQASFGGGTRDAFATKVDAAGGLVFSTYVGGGDRDEGQAITIDPSANVYLTGFTFSTNFPTANATQGALRGGADCFVTKLNASGNALVYSTYLGGSNNDQGTDISVDAAGKALVAAGSTSSDFPRAVPFSDGERDGIALEGQSGSSGCCGHGFAVATPSFLPQLKLEYTVYNRGLNTNVNAIAEAPDGTTWAATDSGVYKQDFGSYDWIQKYKSEPGEVATAITATISSVYAGFSGGTKPVRKSSNGGLTWPDGSDGLPNNTFVRAMLASKREDLNVDYLLVDLGLRLYSRDDASPWKELPVPGNAKVTNINADPATGRRYAVLTDSADSNGSIHEIDRDRVLPNKIASAIYTGIFQDGLSGSLFATVSRRDAVWVGSLRRGSFNGPPFIESTLGPVGGATSFSSFEVVPNLALGKYHGLLGNPSGLYDFEFGAPGASAVTPYRISVTSLIYNSKTGSLLIGSKFGESLDIAGLDPLGGLSSVDCLVSDGNSQSAKAQFGLDRAAVVSASVAGKRGFDGALYHFSYKPKIKSANVESKALIVNGNDFDDGAKILINGERQKKTANDESSPTTKLIAKKAAKLIGRGETVSLQVQTASGLLSEPFSYTRPQ